MFKNIHRLKFMSSNIITESDMRIMVKEVINRLGKNIKSESE